jgi:dienelactone hydrolase
MAGSATTSPVPPRIFQFLVIVFASASQAFAAVQTLDTPRDFPQINTEAQWQNRRAVIRQQVLVSAGLWPMPEKTPLNEKIFGKIERDGYSVEKVYFQSFPGFYMGGNLYRPLGRGNGPFPAILNAHGHWEHGRLEDTVLCSGPGRCINFAKQGMIAFDYDMIGYNDTHFPESSQDVAVAHHSFGTNHPENFLWSISLMGLQTWDSVRALDFLESLPDVDKSRIAATGASGGGTQTFILGAIDDRLAAQAPVVMVSHTMQGGCLCENMPGLRVKFSNMEIAAAAAPRPQILVSDTRDWTKTTLEMEAPAIEGIYKLFNAPEKLRAVRFDFEHNYNQTSREAVYQWFDKWLLNAPDQPVAEVPFHKEIDADLRAFPDGKLPSDAVSEDQLVNYIVQIHKQRLETMLDLGKQKYAKYVAAMMPAWERTIQLDSSIDQDRSVATSGAQQSGFASDQLEITRAGETEPLKAPRFSPAKNRSSGLPTIVILSHPDGASALVGGDGSPAGIARRFLDSGMAVVVCPDSSKAADPDQTSVLFTAYNRTRLQERVRDLTSVCLAVKKTYDDKCHIVLCGFGSCGFSAMLAAPLANAVVADCNQVNTSDDHALMAPDLFCPGIRNIDTFEGALGLVAGNPVLLHNAAAGFSSNHLRSCYQMQHAEKNLKIESSRATDDDIVSWAKKLRFAKD